MYVPVLTVDLDKHGVGGRYVTLVRQGPVGWVWVGLEKVIELLHSQVLLTYDMGLRVLL